MEKNSQGGKSSQIGSPLALGLKEMWFESQNSKNTTLKHKQDVM
jgi:hypothetical protein